MAREFSNQFDEKYVLPLVPPGDYRILAFDTPQRLEYRNPVVLRTYESKGQVVHIAAGQKVASAFAVLLGGMVCINFLKIQVGVAQNEPS